MGFPSDDPEAVVVARIDAQTSLTSGTDLFRGPERPPDPDSGMPHAAVFVRLNGGTNSHDMGVASSDRMYRLQVVIRGNVDGRAAAITTANACLSAVTRVFPSETGYVWMTSRDASWFDQGVDDTEHPRLSFNVQLTFSG